MGSREDTKPVIFGMTFVLGLACATNVGGFAAFMVRAHRERRWWTNEYSAKTTTGVRLTGVAFMVVTGAVLIAALTRLTA